MGALGRDWKARMAARFGGRLYAATFTKNTVTGQDPDDPSGPPSASSATYTCSAIALGYEERYIDGEDIKKGDYRVMILRGTILDEDGVAADVVPNPGDTVSCPSPGGSTPVASRVVSVKPITEAFATCQVRGTGV